MNITCITLHPTNPTRVYAGTEDAGIWVSEDGGLTWAQQSDGMSKGLSATTPFPNPGNIGNGSISSVTASEDVRSETWTLTCETEATDGGVFAVTASLSGAQTNKVNVGVPYVSDDASVSFTLFDGSLDFEVGDAFTFDTIRDPGKGIKDILVDYINNKIYAITYFRGALIPHAVGNVYVHALNADGTFPAGDWQETNQGLPQYDPPDDTTLFAQHALAIDDPTGPSTIYVGGEGINFYRSGGLGAGQSLDWKSSKSGLTNLIMARMPILFSGECSMKIYPHTDESWGQYAIFRVYIEDINGNPPIAGSELLVEVNNVVVLFEMDYADTLTYAGTFRDRNDKSTDNPFIIGWDFALGSELHFEFTPADTLPDPPGSSGSYQKIIYKRADLF